MLYLVVAVEGGIRVDEVDVVTETAKQYKIDGTIVDRKLVRKAELNELMEYEYPKSEVGWIPLPFIFTLKEEIEESKQKVKEKVDELQEKTQQEYEFYSAIKR